MTQVAEIETRIPQPENLVNSTLLQSTNAYQNNTKINKPTSSVPKKNNIKTNKKPINTIRQTKISDMLGPNTSTVSSNSKDKPIKCQNEWSARSNNTEVEQSLGKRLASSPVHKETKKPPIKHYISEVPEDIWENMDVDVLNPLVKVLKFASVVKNSKIQVKQNKWICSGIVTDETGQKEVEFSSEVGYI